MNNPTHAILQNVRFSYCNVWQPSGFDGGEQKYSVSILIPKSDQATLQKVQAAVQAAMQADAGKLATNGAVNPNTLRTPLRDGDAERPEDPAYRGHYFFNAASRQKPQIVDGNVNPILDQSEFYSGCYGNVSINFYGYNSNGNKGIAAGLRNIQKVKDGEALSGGSTAAEDFGPVGGQAPQQQYGQQQYQQPQQQQYNQQPQQQYGQPQQQQQYNQQPQQQAPQQGQQQYQPPNNGFSQNPPF